MVCKECLLDVWIVQQQDKASFVRVDGLGVALVEEPAVSH
jgi:hypothetical protein